jgi:hypothetical protein
MGYGSTGHSDILGTFTAIIITSLRLKNPRQHNKPLSGRFEVSDPHRLRRCASTNPFGGVIADPFSQHSSNSTGRAKVVEAFHRCAYCRAHNFQLTKSIFSPE